ncbi:MAG TPA: SDR family NAD(P)-dependent oxidoreductase, partial [Candidatus Krumholzibacterium sp.]|nr:SDR family NAD(P)-dependent oxidoreductase [Candidatus Krumholzibacterium sp.]
MDLGIRGKTALVVAGTRGLGFGCASALAAEGARIVVNGRNSERGGKAAAELGNGALFVRADISLPEERERLYEQAL